jgi:2-polyprenyl-3-methyl-5-hydroxy-6-metoxy-1,4-benzoquinol methylase/L-ascorbate metabolism protein UlaG (beta-lactamase superfamily)
MKRFRNTSLILGFLLAVLAGAPLARDQAQVSPETSGLAEPREKRANEIQPPELVMEILGIRPGLVIGEVGAGRGRVTVHLAARVGETGKVYANDIDPAAVEYLKARCRRQGLANVETILSLPGDACFPPNSLDLALMTWVYHHVDDPVPLLKSLLSSLKPWGAVALVEPKPERTEPHARPLTRSSVGEEARAAGFTLDAVIEDRLKNDNVFILRPAVPDAPESSDRQKVRALWLDYLAWTKAAQGRASLRDYAVSLDAKGVPGPEVRRRLQVLRGQFTEQPEGIEMIYDPLYGKTLTGDLEKDGFKTQPNAFLVEAMKAIPPGGQALDVGAGMGRNAIHLASLGWDVTGIDLSAQGLAVMRANAEKAGLKVQTVKTSYEDFDFGRERWDLVAMILSWAPVEEPSFLARLKASVRPGGYVIFEHVLQRSENPFPSGVHALAPGALRELFGGFEILTYREMDLSGDWGGPPTPHVRMVARKRGQGIETPAPQDHGVQIKPLCLTRVANCGVLVSAGDTKVLIDALFDKPNPEYRAPTPKVLEKMMKGAAPFDGVDLVLVTHNHPDHFDAGLAVRYLEAHPDAALAAPSDAVADLRRAAVDWAKIEPRVLSLDLKVGERATRELNGIRVDALRTLHSGDLDAPMNLMYLVELGGWRIFHEGDSNGKPDVFQGFGLGREPVDLALVHYWFPLDPGCAAWLQVEFKPEHIALTHLPVRLEGDAPGKIDLVRSYYKDIFLLLPGMPSKVFEKQRRSPDTFFGQPAPGAEPVKFWPEVLTVGYHPHGQLAFAPDGTGVFWSAMPGDGPDQTIFYSVFDGKGFSRPAVAPFAAAKGNGGPAFSADGRRLFFNVELPPEGDSSAARTAICYVERSGAGWTNPAPIESTVGADMTKGQVSVARSGNIYFSGRVLTERAPAIYVCRYSAGAYSRPEKLAGPLADVPFLIDPWIDPDERFLLVSCPSPEGPSMLPDIGICFHRADGTWALPVRLGGSVNTPAFERFSSLSPDGKYLFFIRSLSPQFVGDQAFFYWVDAKTIKELPARAPN